MSSEQIGQQTKLTYEDYKKLKTLVDLGYFLENYVVSGGVATKDVTKNNYINATEIVVSLDNDVTRRAATSFTTAIANATYYLDYQAGDFKFGMSHPPGSYLPVAQVTTDANKNVSVITDKRGSIGGLRLKDEIYSDSISKRAIDGFNIPNTLYKLLTNQPVTIVFAGDSITSGAGAQSNSTSWVELFKAQMQILYPHVTFTFQNSSVGGTGTTYLRDNWSTMVVPYTPDLIIISHGTNDTATTVEDIKSNYNFFYTKTNEIGAEVMVVTTSTNSFSPDPYGNTNDPTVTNAMVVEAELVREMSRKYRWGLIDPNLTRLRYLASQNKDNTSTLTHWDHIHPNDLGHRLIAYEAMMPFVGGQNTRYLDDRYGGENFQLFGKGRTLLDLEELYGQTAEWARFDLHHQQVTWGGLWDQHDESPFKSADLWSNLVTTGSETYKFADPLYHIIPNTNDFIELTVTNPRRVWTQLTGSSAPSTTFSVTVNGVITQALFATSSDDSPLEIWSDVSGANVWPKGTYKIRIERLSAIPAPEKVYWGGLLVQYHKFNQPEKNPNVNRTPKSINTKNVNTTTRLIARDNGVVFPFGTAVFDGGFVQAPLGLNVMTWKFFGTECKITLKSRTVTNKLLVYLDGSYNSTINPTNPTTTDLVYTFPNLSPNIEHEIVLIGMGTEINLVNVYAKGSGSGFGVCGVPITLEGFNASTEPRVISSAYYPETGKIGFRVDGSRDYIETYTSATWNTLVNFGVTYVETTSIGTVFTAKFHGNSILIRFIKSTSGGQFSVTIDGVNKGTVETYDAVASVASQSYAALGDGYHELKITMLGTKHPSAPATPFISIVDFEQTGITIPTFQYVSKLTPTELIVTGVGEFMYEVY